ncbi:MAG: DUF86 domain-containing protein [Parcubacteria group bacterium]|nr:DUF86 domain-containing protein [Parcubacteria group bacterium]
MLNQSFIKEKIDLIGKELAYLEKISQYSMEEIVGNFTLQAAFERFLERIVTRAIDVNEHIIEELADATMKSPRSYKETFFSLARLNVLPEDLVKALIKSVDTRHALVHDYDEFRLSSIYSSVKECLEDYSKYCDYILKFLDKAK